MDKSDINFYKVIADAYTANDDEFAKDIPIPTEFLDRLKKLMSNSLYEELYDMLMGFMCEYQTYSVAMGMKLAIAIMDGKYIPKI